ncbi:MAG TPA: hypothetical protein VES42_08960 [Pilimelia sp.]|nr:hypothetical protein [Pilimelia sp.]
MTADKEPLRYDDLPGVDEQLPVQDPAPLPTAFGATTVASAVAASAMAGEPGADRSDAGPDSPVTAELAEGQSDGVVDDDRAGTPRPLS